jgi:hypothetical protein
MEIHEPVLNGRVAFLLISKIFHRGNVPPIATEDRSKALEQQMDHLSTLRVVRRNNKVNTLLKLIGQKMNFS